MSNAGYGNHDAPPPNAANTDVKRPGPAGAETAKDGTNAAPSSAAASAPDAAGRRDVSTPGAGALEEGRQGDDVDPGVG